MPAAIPILVAVTAASSIYQAVDANQQRQHAKGAAEAQKTAMNAQMADLKKSEDVNKTQKADAGKANQAAAMEAVRSAMSTNNAGGGTILTGPQGAAPAPIAQKTLLGL